MLAITFAIDGLGYVGAARHSAGRQRLPAWLAAAGDLGVAVALVVALRQISETWLVSLAAALRLLGIAWAMAVTPVHTTGDAAGTVIDDLGLTDLLAQITLEERARTAGDHGWVVAFIITLFAIHIARQEVDGTLLGYAAPAIAVVGDMALAVLFAFLVVAPVALPLQTSTRWFERIVWRWYLSTGEQVAGRAIASRPCGCAIAFGWRCACARRASPSRPRSGGAWPRASPWRRSSRRRFRSGA